MEAERKKWQRYTREYKISAVKMVEEGRPAREVARNLGIHENLLYRWKQDYEKHGAEGFPGHGRLRPEENELRQLRRALEKKERECEILKKAVAIFSKTPQ